MCAEISDQPSDSAICVIHLMIIFVTFENPCILFCFSSFKQLNIDDSTSLKAFYHKFIHDVTDHINFEYPNFLLNVAAFLSTNSQALERQSGHAIVQVPSASAIPAAQNIPQVDGMK